MNHNDNTVAQLLAQLEGLDLSQALELRQAVEQRIAALALDASNAQSGLGVGTQLRAGGKMPHA